MTDRKLPSRPSSERDVASDELDDESGDASFDDDEQLDAVSDLDAARALDPREDLDGILEAIASSARPRPISDDIHERILRVALGLTDESEIEVVARDIPAEVVTASAEESARAEALRRALELSASTIDLDSLDGIEHPDVMRLVALARALRLAFSPPAIAPLTSERLLKPALSQPTRRGNVRLLFATTTVLAALAAAFVGLWLSSDPAQTRSARLDDARAALPMIPVRSTEALFEPLDAFPRTGGASERIDKISASRGAELRNNRFAAWGIE